MRVLFTVVIFVAALLGVGALLAQMTETAGVIGLVLLLLALFLPRRGCEGIEFQGVEIHCRGCKHGH